MDSTTFNYPDIGNGLNLTDEFKKAYDLLESGNPVTFITGNAGCGKSTFLKWWLSNTTKRVAVLSPTGIGATLLHPIKASTIHRFFGFKPVMLHEANIPRIRDNEKSKFNAIDVIVIDEISMVSSLMLQAIHLFYRINFYSQEPFGGKQLVLVGDLFQLPPVIPDKAELEYINHKFDSKYFFSATALQETGITMVNFSKVFRQSDDQFLDYLNKVRMNTVTSNDIDALNKKCFIENRVDSNATMLCTTNYLVKKINDDRLEKLSGDWITLTGDIEGSFNNNNSPVEEVIMIKVGCKIMMRNNDKDGNWINGTTGTFLGKKSDVIVVEINGIPYDVQKFTFTQQSYKFNQKTEKVELETTASLTQYPISVAYASSIHKSQGATLSEYIIDMGRGTFDYGQMYVALSRGKDFNKIAFKSPIKITDVKADPIIIEWFNNNIK